MREIGGRKRAHRPSEVGSGPHHACLLELECVDDRVCEEYNAEHEESVETEAPGDEGPRGDEAEKSRQKAEEDEVEEPVQGLAATDDLERLSSLLA